jgi:hypothetical protein
MKSLFLMLGCLALLHDAAAQAVVINGQPLAAPARAAIEQRTGVPLVPGRWWYDARSGLWGAEGQGPSGLAPAALPVEAPLGAAASAGRTGVFVNGRDLTVAEVRWLQSLGPVWPGRYWLDAWGNVGLEGQAVPFVNLPQRAAAVAAATGAGTTHTTPGGTWISSGGGCVSISAKSSSGIGRVGASNC